MTLPSLPWTLLQAAATPADSVATPVTSAGIGGETAIVIVLAVAVIGGLVAMFAGDVVKRHERK